MPPSAQQAFLLPCPSNLRTYFRFLLCQLYHCLAPLSRIAVSDNVFASYTCKRKRRATPKPSSPWRHERTPRFYPGENLLLLDTHFPLIYTHYTERSKSVLDVQEAGFGMHRLRNRVTLCFAQGHFCMYAATSQSFFLLASLRSPRVSNATH